jgi:hypothetical protein
VEILRKGGVIVYPTDSSYALGCQVGDKEAMDRIRQIRRLDDRHNFTLVCRDLAEVSQYTRIGNQQYRLIKSLTPGPYTFILKATKQVPRRLMHPRRKTIGIRIPDNRIALAPGGVVETIPRSRVPAINQELFLRIPQHFGANLLGIDVIMEEGVEHPWNRQRCIFLEVNSRPFVAMHHFPRFGKQEDLATAFRRLEALPIDDTDVF